MFEGDFLLFCMVWGFVWLYPVPLYSHAYLICSDHTQEFHRICKSVLLQISDIDNIHVDYSTKSLFFQQIFPFKYKR